MAVVATERASALDRALPSLALLRRYDRTWLRGDVLAGVTVAAYAVPQVMAYAAVAGLPPVVGLYAILPPLAIYAFVGSSRQLSVGPESTTALLAATIVAPLAAGDLARYAALSAVLALVVAAYCLIARVFRLGLLADLLSRPVLVGYLAGVALIMIAGQLGRLTGVDVEGTGFVEEVRSFVSGIGSLQWEPLAFGLGALAVLFLVQWLAPRVPGPLLVVLLAASLVAAFGLVDRGIEVVGTVPVGLPTPRVPDVSWSEVQALLLPALGVMIVGFADNVLESRAFAARGGYEVDSNQELVALGAINAGAGLFQGFPVSSSGSRTALGDAVGSRSQLYSLITLASIIATLLFFRPVLAYFPTAVLGAIVVYAAIRLIQVSEFVRLRRFRWSECVLALATVLGVVLLDILNGVLLAVALSVLELLGRVARPHDGVLGLVPGLAGMHSVDDYPEARTVPGLVVYRYDSPLFFANAADFRRRALAAVAAQPEPVLWFVLNVEANVEVDITATDMLEQLREDLDRRGIELVLARVKQDLLVRLEGAGIAERIGPDRMFPTLPTAVAGYHAWRAERGLPDVTALV